MLRKESIKWKQNFILLNRGGKWLDLPVRASMTKTLSTDTTEMRLFSTMDSQMFFQSSSVLKKKYTHKYAATDFLMPT